MKTFTCIALVAALGSSTLLTSCETATGTGALAGATAGAIIGSNTGPHSRYGNGGRTLAGAGIGALAGALIGSIVDENRASRRYNDDEYDDQGDRRGRRYPYGESTDYRGYVRSPYRPYNIIDVRGIPRGALVIDPSTDRPFRNP
jgi:Glycine zipper